MAENELAISQMKRLATHLPDPVYEELKQWASQEKRSLYNLVAFLLEKAVNDCSERQKKTDRDEAKD
jgi:hypothetical protein